MMGRVNNGLFYFSLIFLVGYLLAEGHYGILIASIVVGVLADAVHRWTR